MTVLNDMASNLPDIFDNKKVTCPFGERHNDLEVNSWQSFDTFIPLILSLMCDREAGCGLDHIKETDLYKQFACFRIRLLLIYT
jgi:hypothetical protein